MNIHHHLAEANRLLSVLMALTLVFNGIVPAFVRLSLAGAAEPEETPLSK